MDLPDFDNLVELAEQHPEELEALRQRCNQQLVDAAPEHMKQRMNGLLFKIDMEKRRSKNPTQACIRLSRLMADSYIDMQSAILNLKSSNVSQEDSMLITDNVIFLAIDNSGGVKFDQE